MSDFEYDAYLKKRVANGARKRNYKYRQPGYITDKEIKKRSGETVEYNLHKPMDWSIFKKLSIQSQKEYLAYVINTYGAKLTHLAEMFGVQTATIQRHIANNELGFKFHVGHSMTRVQRVEWENFLKSEEEDSTLEPEISESFDDMIESVDAIEPKSIVKQTKMNRISLSFNGAIDIDMIMNSLRYILGSNAHGQIEISCELE